MLFSKVLSEGGKQARLAQSVERQALNLVVGGSSPPVGDSFFLFLIGFPMMWQGLGSLPVLFIDITELCVGESDNCFC